jgi:hypothetical protein
MHRPLHGQHSLPDSEGVKTCRARSWHSPSDSAGCLRRGVVRASVAAVLLVSTGCASTSVPAQRTENGPTFNGPTLTWSKVRLPPDVEPVTLSASGPQLLVGGFAAKGTVKPRLLRISPDGSSTQVPLTPRSGYANEARWRSVATDGNKIIAVGGASGGAHSNTRWTVWTGTNAGVREMPQPFETFGGWGAGELFGPALTSAGPAVAGSWEGARSGLDAAIWLLLGNRWVRQSSAGSALESTRELLVGPRSATGAGTGMVLPGSAVHLTDGKVRQSAALWRSKRLNGGWARVDLPDSGATGEAVSAQCNGGSCLVAGYVDGALAMWQLSSQAAARITGVPKVALDPRSPVPAPLVTGSRIIEVVSTGVLNGSSQKWTLSRGPIGHANSSALVGGWVYVIAAPAGGAAVLWRCPLTDLR